MNIRSIYSIALLGILVCVSGCTKTPHGIYAPTMEYVSADERSLVAKPTLKFAKDYVQVSHTGSAEITEYEYRVSEGSIEIIIPEAGVRQIWKLEIVDRDTLRDGKSTWARMR